MSGLFDTDGSVIPNITLAVYRADLSAGLKNQRILSASIEFRAEPGTEQRTAREIARKLPHMEVSGVWRVSRLEHPR